MDKYEAEAGETEGEEIAGNYSDAVAARKHQPTFSVPPDQPYTEYYNPIVNELNKGFSRAQEHIPCITTHDSTTWTVERHTFLRTVHVYNYNVPISVGGSVRIVVTSSREVIAEVPVSQNDGVIGIAKFEPPTMLIKGTIYTAEFIRPISAVSGIMPEPIESRSGVWVKAEGVYNPDSHSVAEEPYLRVNLSTATAIRFYRFRGKWCIVANYSGDNSICIASGMDLEQLFTDDYIEEILDRYTI